MSGSENQPVRSRVVGGSRERLDSPLIGIALMVIGILLLGINDALIKVMVERHPLGQMIFMRGFFALFPMAWLVWRAGGWQTLAWRSISGQIGCALLLTLALFLFVYSLSILPLGLATIMVYTNPIMVAALAPFVLGEKVGWRRWSAVVLGFAGAALVFFPADSHLVWGLFLPLSVALLSALRDLLIRLLVRSETSISIFASAHIMVMVVAACTLVGGWVPLTMEEIALLAINGLVFCFAIYFMTESFRYAEASLVSPFKYIGVVVGLLLGFAFWDEVPSDLALIGAAVIVASGLFISFRERRHAQVADLGEKDT
ncbi:MAG: DMT family transporter [Pseudomonadota bacterium]